MDPSTSAWNICASPTSAPNLRLKLFGVFSLKFISAKRDSFKQVALLTHDVQKMMGLESASAFFNHRRINIRWKAAQRARNFIAHIIRGCFQVNTQFKLNSDAARPFATYGKSMCEYRNTIHGIFQRFSYLRLDYIRVRAHVGGWNSNYGRINTGELANPKNKKTDIPKQDNHQAEHRGKYRPVNADGW